MPVTQRKSSLARWLLFPAFAAMLAACAGVPGKREKADGLNYAYQRSPQGGPTVVFESGLGDGMDKWAPVIERVSGFASIFAYDRAGYGDSDSTRKSRDGAQIVADLRALLRQAGATPPYVLVGHSLGGTYMEFYARTYPEEVAGLVLVEARHHDFGRRCKAAGAAVCEPPSLMMAAMPGGASAEYRDMPLTMSELEQAPTLKPMPLVVLTGTAKFLEGPTFHRVWLETQKELAASSPQGRHIICDQCGHYVQSDRPDLVTDAIRDMLGR